VEEGCVKKPKDDRSHLLSNAKDDNKNFVLKGYTTNISDPKNNWSITPDPIFVSNRKRFPTMSRTELP
jgi:hypothetical protein